MSGLCCMDRVTYDFRVLASPRHAPLDTLSRFRGAGCGVREGGALSGAVFIWPSASNWYEYGLSHYD